jgi:hypothetical protein
MRVAVRLIRVDNGYVVWSETYERPWGDLLKVQNDIAAEVTAAVRASIEGRSDHGQAVKSSTLSRPNRKFRFPAK